MQKYGLLCVIFVLLTDLCTKNMKKQLAYFLACACLFWGSACSLSSTNETTVSSEDDEHNRLRCIFKRDKNKRLDNTNPFDKATKIEAITFDFDERDRTSGSIARIENGKLILNKIRYRETLNTEKKQALFETLFGLTGKDNAPSKCYNPIHILVFYEGEQAISFLEICFKCGSRYTYNANFTGFCSEKWEKLKTFFPTPKKEN